LQMWGLGNTSFTPEGYGFMQLLYGPNAGLSNLPRFNLPEYNEAYAKGKHLPNGPERNKLLHQMSELVSVYAPWHLLAYRYENILTWSWLLGYKYNPFNAQPWLFWDIDPTLREAMIKKQ